VSTPTVTLPDTAPDSGADTNPDTVTGQHPVSAPDIPDPSPLLQPVA
jgi:hypothetical protein